MLNLETNSTNPYYNLAFEEYFLKNSEITDDILILWQNAPTVVIGKHQNAYEELNLAYIDEHDVKVVRRMSGGGAVYHDLGNLNFTIIKNDGAAHQYDFSFFTKPVIKALNKLGVHAELSGRNDIEIDGKKCSGNAQYFHNNRLLHHGAILFSSDLDAVSKALNVKKEKYISKGVKSVKSRVANISDFLTADVTIEEFKKLIITEVSSETGQNLNAHDISEYDKTEIKRLETDKYGNWEWNFGKSPKMQYRNEIRFAGGCMTGHMNVSNGYISGLKLYGDFFDKQPLENLEKLIIGTKLGTQSLSELLSKIELSDYIVNLTKDDILNLLTV